MASPHIAGLAALIMHLRPRWSPAEIKSAMMTTAYNLEGQHGPFTQGAGHVNPRRFLHPGLVYDAGFSDWFALLTGQQRASNVNQPSIALSNLTGVQTVRRTVTNTTGRERYTAKVTGMKGVKVAVSPQRFTIGRHGVKRFTVRFTATSRARFNKYTTGHLIWSGSRGHVVRSPLAVRPVPVDAPAEITGSGASGSRTVSGRSGFTGQLDLAVSGLTGATPTSHAITAGPFDPNNPTADADTYEVTQAVPAGTAVVRFNENADNTDDADMYVYVNGTLIALSASESADEQVTINRPPAGSYHIFVNGFADAGGGIDSTFTGWVVPRADAGNLTVSPDPVPVQIGKPFSYTAAWTGLSTAQRWFGLVRYPGTGARTYVTIN